MKTLGQQQYNFILAIISKKGDSPENSLAMDLGRMILAALMMSSMVTLPLCLMFFTFFLSRGGSFSALITSAAAEGTTVTCIRRDPHAMAIFAATSPAALAAAVQQTNPVSTVTSNAAAATISGVPRGDAQDARASPPPQPERLVMRKDEAMGNKKKMQVCLPKHNYKFDNHL
jgi:hypothetical protein